jgi:drug/metabolite transporter (DMT)-like permease
MQLWFLLSLSAGILQAIRNSTSKSLSKSLHPITITLVRFGYGIPFVLLFYVLLDRLQLSTGAFTSYTVVCLFLTAIFQSTANALLVKTFKMNNFLTAITLNKSEGCFAALIGYLFLKQTLSLRGVLALIISSFGILLSFKAKSAADRAEYLFEIDQAFLYGLTSGFIICLSAISTREGILSFQGGNQLANSSFYLLLTLVIQTLGLLFFIICKMPHELVKMIKNTKTDIIVGAASALGSICWFFAFTLAHVALVKTVGQIEMLLSGIVSLRLFKEKISLTEICGSIFLTVGIVILAFEK